MKKRPTIKDIAKIARVSIPAVSMALRGHTRIGQETRQRILRIARRLNYQPNFVARSLVIRKTNTIGLIITTILNPFYPELAKGIEDKAMELGYNIILCSTNYDLKLEKYFINILRSKGVDGIIFSSVEAHDPNIRPLIQDHFPFILVNRRVHNRLLNKRIDTITLDNFLGGSMAVEHLYKLGHRRIGIVAGDLRISTAIERLEGAKKFFEKVGLGFEESLLIDAHFSKELAYQATQEFMSLKNPPTAISAQNDYMALGVREAILDSGLRIPEDVALIGFDNISISGLKGIEMTTIGQKRYEMGTLAVEMLVEKIEKGDTQKVNHIMLEPEIIVRNSCGYRLHAYRNEVPRNSHGHGDDSKIMIIHAEGGT